MFQTNLQKKSKLLCSVAFFRQSCCLWDNVENIVKLDWPQMTIWRMRIAFWIPKSSKTRPEYVILIAFTRQKWLRESTPLLPLYIASVVILSLRANRLNTVDLLHFTEHMMYNSISTYAVLDTVGTETASVYFVSCRSETKHCYTGIDIRFLYLLFCVKWSLFLLF